MYSEKATTLETIFQYYYFSLLNNVKEIGRLFQIFVAFLEYYTNLPIFQNGIKDDIRFHNPWVNLWLIF